MDPHVGVPPGQVGMSEPGVVERYIELGLGLGRHVDGFVDAYFGPQEIADRVERAPITPPATLAEEARRLLADIEGGADDLDAGRRHFLAAQARGLRTSARKLAGEPIGYPHEVQACHGVRARTTQLFGLPDGEHVDFELVTNEPWSGFNYYLGGLRSLVAINTDLPVLSPNLAHLVAHEAYPGHHTEHSRKESGLVRRRGQLEETIFLVGTPQCLVAEGLADLGIEVAVSPDPEGPAAMAASHLKPLGVPFDAEVAAVVARAGEGLSRVRGNVGLLLHEEGRDIDEVVAYAERWALLPPARAQKM